MNGRSLALAAVLGSAIVAPGRAIAQSKPQVTAKASASQVEVGEPFSVELRMTADRGGTVSNPELRAPSNLQIVGTTSTRFSTGSSRGISVTWQIVAQKPGHYAIPGPSLSFEGKRISTNPLPIEVVAASGKSQKPQVGNPFNNPFLSPGLKIPWLFGDEEPDDEPDDRDAPDLNMPSGPDPLVFMRAVADKNTAVIGEQVTISFYTYNRIPYQGSAARDAPLADFRHVPLLPNAGNERVRRAKVGKDPFNVRLIDKVAAFPLRAGELHTGSRWERIFSPRLGGNSERQTDDLIITVTEPPLAGRPPGYRIGDVGQFSLTVTVEPRKIDQGSGAAVTIKVAGSGNFPESLRVPERTGIEWLDPEKKESIGPQNGVVGGFRTFAYVVRVKNSGNVDLGAVELPYWDPSTKKYDVARVEIGSLEVKPVIPAHDPSAKFVPSAAGDPGSSANPFGAIQGPRMALGAFTVPRAPLWHDGRTLWLLLVAPPLLVGFHFAGTSALSRRRARRAEEKESPAALAEKALGDADTAEEKGDGKALAAAVERAVHLAVEAATALKSRGILLAELSAELAAHGVPEALAAEVHATLSTCESVRFEPSEGSSSSGLAAQARKLVRELSRIKAP